MKVFSRACNSDSEMLAALQTVDAGVRTPKHRLDEDNQFPMFLGCSTWQQVFCRDLDPCWFERRVVTMM